jgi:hypothetical protein
MKTIKLHSPINYHLLITGALILLPFALALFKLALLGVPKSEPLRAMVLIATPTTMPTVVPTEQPQRPLVAYWAPGEQPVAILDSDVQAVVGQAEAGRWVMVSLQDGARVWLAADQLPAAVPVGELTDYTPQATAMPAAVQPPSAQLQAPQAPVETATPCWGGVPMVYEEGLAPCWQGVPFVVE